MYAKYKITDTFRNYISKVRKNDLGYSYDEMEVLVEELRSGSWFHDVCSGTKTETMSITDMKLFFLLEYNCYVFQIRINKLNELMNGDETITIPFKEKTKKIDRLVCEYEPPKSIFTEEDEGFPKIFTEERMEGCPKYISIKKCTNTDESFETEEYLNFSKYIARRSKELLDTVGPANIGLEYGLFAMYLMYKDVSINTEIWEYIHNRYFDKNEGEFSWREIYSKLSSKGYEPSERSFTDRLSIYFKRNTNEQIPISKTNLPIMYVNYKVKRNNKVYELRRERAVKGILRVIDLFMIIFRDFLEQGYSEDDSFTKTYIFLSEHNVEPPFIQTNIVNIPPKSNYNMRKMADFYKCLEEFFEKNELTEDDRELKTFKTNLFGTNPNFLHAISVDFKFIKDIDYYTTTELRNRIEKTVEAFKDDFLS